MIEGFKNREVLTMPMQYTCSLLPSSMRQEYAAHGSISIPHVTPPEKPKDDYRSHDWDAKDGFRSITDDDLLDYLNWIDEHDEDEEGGWI